MHSSNNTAVIVTRKLTPRVDVPPPAPHLDYATKGPNPAVLLISKAPIDQDGPA